MKSIMEEASSLAKAFTQAWERAGKPQECTIKILAEPEKNFIGMTTKSAKIAIFFNEPAPSQQKRSHQQPTRRTPQQPQQPRTQSGQRQTEQRPSNETSRQETQKRSVEVTNKQPKEQKPQQREHTPREQVVRKNTVHEATSKVAIEETTKTTKPATPRVRPTWTEEMTQGARTWIQESLQIMDCPGTEFTTTISRSILTVVFSKPLIEDIEKERLLFRSWSHLIVQHIKQEFKVHGKELKIILKGSRI